MLVKSVAVWITMSAILTFATAASTPSNSTTITEKAEHGAGDKTRIHMPGGRPVELGEFPFLVLLAIDLYGEDWRTYCSGSIPSPTTVLSAAHCHGGDLTAFAGLVNNSAIEANDSSVQVRRVVSVRKPNHHKIYDIMICYVNQSWLWTAHVRPVPIHLAGEKFRSLQPSFVVRCLVMGFGYTDTRMQLGVAHVMEQLVGAGAQCASLHPLFWFVSFWMCSINVENKTTCPGDSGGPVLCSTGGEETQWGVNHGISRGGECTVPKAGNFYVATASLGSWIMDNIKDLPSTGASVRCPSVNIFTSKALSFQSLWLLIVLFQH